MEFHPFPFVRKYQGSPEDGFLVKVPRFCSKTNRKACLKFYDSLGDSQGIFTCPYGFSTVVHSTADERIIYTCLRIVGKYDRKKVKRKIEFEFSPEIPEQIIDDSIATYTHFRKIMRGQSSPPQGVTERTFLHALSGKQADEFVNSLFHELRKLNTQVKRLSEDANTILDREYGHQVEPIRRKIHSIFAASSLMPVRLSWYDVAANPEIIFSQPKQDFEIYKKFEKVTHCLYSMAKDKNIQMELKGKCYLQITGYPIFDLLPFLLIENAIKFSPNDQMINIEFEAGEKELEISISSLGPTLKKNERPLVFQRGFRGHHASQYISGTGAGLYFAKTICDVHNIDVSVSSAHDKVVHIDGIPFCPFTVKLVFNEVR